MRHLLVSSIRLEPHHDMCSSSHALPQEKTLMLAHEGYCYSTRVSDLCFFIALLLDSRYYCRVTRTPAYSSSCDVGLPGGHASFLGTSVVPLERNGASLAVALKRGIGSSALKADVNAFESDHIVRGRNSSYAGSK